MRILLITILFSVFGFANANSSDTSKIDTAVNDTAKTHIVEINKLLQRAESQLGTRYQWAGKKPGGFDCSGFVLYCYGSTLGISLPPSATEYYHYGKAVKKQNALPGDVICFTGSYAYTKSIGHVGIITEVTPTEIYFIHSALNGGVRYDCLSLAYYKTRFLGIRRILN